MSNQRSIEEILTTKTDAFKSVVEISMKRLGLPIEEAYEKALETEEKAQNRQLKANENTYELRNQIKQIIRNMFGRNKRTTITAKEVTDELVSRGRCDERDARGIGDLLGRGPSGLFLEPKQKRKGRNAYLIPDPMKFVAWYESDDPLPADYYSKTYLDFLLTEEYSRSNSPFFKHWA